jgi:hypothetical protein
VGPMGDSKRSVWPDGCGNGRWCWACRQEIRDEALSWLRALNVTPEQRENDARIIDLRPWHRQWLLADK